MFKRKKEKSINELHAVAQHWIHLQKVYSDGIELADKITQSQIEKMIVQKCLVEGHDVRGCQLIFDKEGYHLEIEIVSGGVREVYKG